MTTISRDNIVDWLVTYASVIAGNKDYLTRLDSEIGDADHGANMYRGFQAVVTKLPAAATQDIGSIFKLVGMTLVGTVGGASGPLYGTLFMSMGTAAVGKTELSLDEWTAALQTGVDGVIGRGKARPGDKTMIDALLPALDALKSATANGGTALEDALRQSADAAKEGMLDTIPLVARKGRASYLGERSAGHQDPGATSSYYLLDAAAKTCAGNA